MFETGIEMGLESQVHNHRVVVAVDVCIHPIKSLEDLANQTRECLGEGDSCYPRQTAPSLSSKSRQ